MAAQIIDRGRGPEIEGTRVTVYRIMDFLREESPLERIAVELDLTNEQLREALAYVKAHQREIEKGYEAILQRVNQSNPPWVEAGRPATAEQLQK